MGPFEMVVAIVAIVMVASIVRAKIGIAKHGKGGDGVHHPDPDAARLKVEVAQLKERIAVLERIATDNNGALDLDREIERLR